MIRKATWLSVSAAGWIALVVLLVWVKTQPASWWRVVEAPLTVVAGGLAAVVAGALLFDPAKKWVAEAAADELEAREDRRWLTDMYPHARATQDVLLQMTALASAILYEAVASTGALSAVIPSETLRRDVRLLPPVPPIKVSASAVPGERAWRDELEAQFQAVAEQFKAMHQADTGPMAVARRQLAVLSGVLGDRVNLDNGQFVPVTEEQWVRLDAATVEALTNCPDGPVADRLVLLTNRMLVMANEVSGVRGFDAAPLKKSLLLLMGRAERLRYMVSSPSWRTRVSYNGGVEGGSPNDPWPETAGRMREVSALFGDLMHVRSELRGTTAETLKAASRLGADTRNEWIHNPFPEDDILGGDFAWGLWCQRNRLEFK